MDGDGNCFFRALSYCLYRDQRQHTTLRASVASYVSRQANVASPEDKDSLRKRAAEVAKDGVWPGEDILLASANFLHQTIRVYLAHGVSSPISYSPSTTSSKPPLSIAFFEPGHYKAVVPNCNSVNAGVQSLPSCGGAPPSGGRLCCRTTARGPVGRRRATAIGRISTLAPLVFFKFQCKKYNEQMVARIN